MPKHANLTALSTKRLIAELATRIITEWREAGGEDVAELADVARDFATDELAAALATAAEGATHA
jgi:hypothetical protein